MSLNEIFISTQRLILRGIKLTDAEAMLKYRSNAKIYEFQNWKPQTLMEVEDFIRNKVSVLPDVPNTWYQLGILIKGTEEVVGDIGIHFLSEDNLQVEIGFTLCLECQGKGYASEGVASVIDYLFTNLGKHRIIASVDPLNTKSIALIERIGMRKEADFRKSIWFNGQWTDDLVYAILEEEWNKD